MAITNGLRPAGSGTEFAGAGSGADQPTGFSDATVRGNKGHTAPETLDQGATGARRQGLVDGVLVGQLGSPLSRSYGVATVACGDKVLRPVVKSVAVQMFRDQYTRPRTASPFKRCAAPMAGVWAGADLLVEDDPMFVHRRRRRSRVVGPVLRNGMIQRYADDSIFSNHDGIVARVGDCHRYS